MLVQFLRGTALGGIGNDAAPGDVIELPDPQARAYLLAGRAIQAPSAAPAAPAAADPGKQTKPKKAK